MSASATTSTVDATRGPEAGWKISDRVLRLLSVILILALWLLLTKDVLGWIPPLKFPSPGMVISSLLQIKWQLLIHISLSLARVLAGLMLGMAVGIGLGLSMSVSKVLHDLLDPLIEALRPLPVIAAIPFFIMWFGIQEQGKILLIAFGVFMVMVVTTVEAVKNVPPIFIQAAQTLGANRQELYRTVILPAVLPALIPGIRVAAALSFTLVVAAEFMGAQSGLGYMIMNARRSLQTATIFLGVLCFAILSFLLDSIIRRAGSYLVRWSERAN